MFEVYRSFGDFYFAEHPKGWDLDFRRPRKVIVLVAVSVPIDVGASRHPICHRKSDSNDVVGFALLAPVIC